MNRDELERLNVELRRIVTSHEQVLNDFAEVCYRNDLLRERGWKLHELLDRAQRELQATSWGEGTEEGILFYHSIDLALDSWTEAV